MAKSVSQGIKDAVKSVQKDLSASQNTKPLTQGTAKKVDGFDYAKQSASKTSSGGCGGGCS